MTSRKKGEGRGLLPFEVALIKGMLRAGLVRDHIMSFIIHPGRIISPAAISDVREGKIGREIEASTQGEVNAYISQRLAEPQVGLGEQFVGPVSEIRVREILRLGDDGQRLLPGFESHIAELKSELPQDKRARGSVVKTMSAFANHRGGYVFFGVNDGGELLGISQDELVMVWEDVQSLISTHFAPFFRWDKAAVLVAGKLIGVIYVHAAVDKPIICLKDYEEVREGVIYYRSVGVTKPISAVDLFALLRERDGRGS